MVKSALFILCRLKGLWKLDGTTLSNKAGITLTGNWKIPGEGYTGPIINTDTGGWMTANGNFAAGSAVVEGAQYASEWKQSVEVSGYFTLMNIYCGKFLTGQSSSTPNVLSIEGNDFSFMQLSYMMLFIFLFTNRIYKSCGAKI